MEHYISIYCLQCRFGFVHYSSVEEAKAVFDKPENIEVDGRVLFIDFITPKQPESENIKYFCKNVLRSIATLIRVLVLSIEAHSFVYQVLNKFSNRMYTSVKTLQ